MMNQKDHSQPSSAETTRAGKKHTTKRSQTGDTFTARPGKVEKFRRAVQDLTTPEVLDISELTGYDPEAVDMLRQSLQKRSDIYWRQQEIKDELDEVTKELDASLTILGINSAYDSKSGRITRVESSRSTLNKDSLREELLKRGVLADVIRESIDAATKIAESSYLKYTPSK